MSLDGFVADESGGVVRLYPDLETFGDTEPGQAAIEATGAVLMGRRTCCSATAFGCSNISTLNPSSSRRLEWTRSAFAPV